MLDDTPLPLALEKDKNPLLAASPLRFPGACPAVCSTAALPACPPIAARLPAHCFLLLCSYSLVPVALVPVALAAAHSWRCAAELLSCAVLCCAVLRCAALCRQGGE
jgi:hypothetical protein